MNLKEFGFNEIDYELFNKTKKPYKIYAELIDDDTKSQFKDVLNCNFVTKAALMPDAHSGYIMPIGAVASCKDVVVPQFVGFDIGCGMCALKTPFAKDDIEKFSNEIYDEVIKRVPLGFSKHKNHQKFKCDLKLTSFANSILQSIGLKQLGTLGGGNHFIEIGYGKDEAVWIVIHSGSRGFGHKIATNYMIEAYKEAVGGDDELLRRLKIFEERNKNFKEHNPNGYEKAYEKFKNKQILDINKKIKPDNIKGIYGLKVDSKLGQEYIKDLNFALNFALENRKLMISRIFDGINEILGSDYKIDFEDEKRFINRNHNHAEYDKDRGEWIHRKGATHAKEGIYGVIPGNMRDGSFVVIGKGNEDSLYSSSHGAGRVLSRRKAKELLSINDFKDAMQGITGTIDESTLDESPFAYKDIFEVMNLQKDLVEVIEHIKPIINVKDKPKAKAY